MKPQLLLLGLLLAGSQPFAQEADDADAGAEPPASEAAAAAEEAAEEPARSRSANDAELDDQLYEGEEDDFKPSEEIPADQSIAFPTDI